MVQLWCGIGIGVDVIHRRNGDIETFLILPFVKIRIKNKKR